jgi:acyl carrier protein
MQDIFEELRPIIAKRLRCAEEQVTLDTEFKKDLGADSIDLVELVMSIETKYDIEFTDEAIERILSVQDAITYVQQLVDSK